MSGLRFGAALTVTGVKPNQLKRWLQIRLIDVPPRDGGWNYFCFDHLVEIAVCDVLSGLGLSEAAIRESLRTVREQWMMPVVIMVEGRLRGAVMLVQLQSLKLRIAARLRDLGMPCEPTPSRYSFRCAQTKHESFDTRDGAIREGDSVCLWNVTDEGRYGSMCLMDLGDLPVGVVERG